MLELFGANTGNSHRAAIALYEADVPFVSKVVDLRGGGHRTPSFLKLNPAAKVPVLVDPDEPFVLTQSNAIMLHAAERGPSNHLLPEDGPSRARALERFFSFVTDAIVWSGAAFALNNRGQGDAAALLETSLVERLEAAERFLAEGPYMAGGRFSLADIAGFTIHHARLSTSRRMAAATSARTMVRTYWRKAGRATWP